MKLTEQFRDAIRKKAYTANTYESELAALCETICKERMAGFAEWLDADGYYQAKVGGIWQNSMDAKISQEKEFTTTELIEQYLKETE